MNIHNERVKLTARFLSNIGVGLCAGAMVLPLLRPAWGLAAALGAAGVAAIVCGVWSLRRLTDE